MKNTVTLHRTFQFINFFSLDVVAGSLMMAFFATKVLEIHPPGWWYLVLALSVWVMYTADHLLDAMKGREYITIQRHRLHYLHRNRIVPLWIASGSAAAAIAFAKLDKEIIEGGLILGILVCLYFLLLYFNRRRRPWIMQKELFISLVYVGGIWMAPLIWYRATLPHAIVLMIVNMVLLAWAEGVLISWYERNEDILNGHTSFTTLFGSKTARVFVISLLLTVAILSALSVFLFSGSRLFEMAFAIQFLMAASLSPLLFRPDFFRKKELYRYLGEFTFLMPGLLIMV